MKILITGANSFVGSSVERWLLREPEKYEIDTVDTVGDNWRKADLSLYDAVFHVAGLAHVDPKPEMAPLYYKVNCDLALEIARAAREAGVGQFIFMSSMIVFRASRSLKGTAITPETEPAPNDFYGDSKLRAEIGLRKLETPDFKVAVLRPCMIYGPGNKGNFPRLARLAARTPVFPAWHNRRSMLYIDNLSEFVRQTLDRRLSGTFHLQNREYADTVELVRALGRQANHSIFISRLFNPLVRVAAPFLKPVSKMFADQYYDSSLTDYPFEYQLVSLEESLSRL